MRLLIYLTLTVIVVAVLLLLRLSPESVIGAMVRPGPLTDAHAEYASSCSECHSPFDKEIQTELCVGCHDEVREDLINGLGYHGRSPSVTGKSCKSCHTEHIGPKGPIVCLDKRTFQHDFTDFRLIGAHADVSVSCDACHAKYEKFRESPKDCIGCHSDDDSHNLQLGTDCTRCHKETSWLDIYFSHNTTCFPLEGKHRTVACDSCHPDKAYLNTSSNCNACHLLNDVHDSKLDEKCDRCHGTESWKEAAFDHDRKTQFVLEGRHTELECDVCHADLEFGKKPGAECIDCHRTSDIHKGNVGLNCDDCHSQAKWDDTAFDHNADTEFELSGRHTDAQCADCHKQSLQDGKPATECSSCHRVDDVHKEQLGSECDSCHSTKGWNEQIVFDHDVTPFPLIGLHAAAACGECHLSPAFKGTDVTCTSCHQSNDYHQGALGAECGNCHNPNGWRLWQFDHSLQTDFKLEGAHAKLECKACHTLKVKGKIELSRACSACHTDDDVHYRRFGMRCDRCHTVESFRQMRIGG